MSFPDYQRNQMFLDEVAHFLGCLEGNESPAIPLSEGVLVLKIALLVKSAMQSGRAVENS
jgi:hypothetical protein